VRDAAELRLPFAARSCRLAPCVFTVKSCPPYPPSPPAGHGRLRHAAVGAEGGARGPKCASHRLWRVNTRRLPLTWHSSVVSSYAWTASQACYGGSCAECGKGRPCCGRSCAGACSRCSAQHPSSGSPGPPQELRRHAGHLVPHEVPSPHGRHDCGVGCAPLCRTRAAPGPCSASRRAVCPCFVFAAPPCVVLPPRASSLHGRSAPVHAGCSPHLDVQGRGAFSDWKGCCYRLASFCLVAGPGHICSKASAAAMRKGYVPLRSCHAGPAVRPGQLRRHCDPGRLARGWRRPRLRRQRAQRLARAAAPGQDG
jgi:hypothetical protein